MKKRTLLLLLLAMGLGMAVGHVLMLVLHAKPLYPLSTRMFFMPNGEPGAVRVHVRDAEGRPVAGAKVRVMHTSGGVGATTLADGTAEFRITAGAIEWMKVNNRLILRTSFLCRVPEGMDVYYLEEKAR